MKAKRYFALTAALLLAFGGVLFVFLGVTHSSVLARGEPTQPAAPVISAIAPSTAPNDLDTPVAISGAGFEAVISGTQVITPPSAFLGDSALADLFFVSSTTLSATVPWGLEPGVYTLTVVNPDGSTGSLGDAFTVTQGLGVWTTNGPYGGGVAGLRLHPLAPSTLYALGSSVGMFASYDSGANWEMVLMLHSWHVDIQFDAQNPDVVYVAGNGNLYRTMDGALTWEIVNDRPGGWPYSVPVAHPTLPGVIISAFGTQASPDPEGGIYRSDDYGSSWYSLTVALTDTHVTSLAIHPVFPETMLAGTESGNLFYSLDGGETWTRTVQLTDTVANLYFNPFEPLQAWATTTGDVDNVHRLYKSEDVVHWAPISVDEDATWADRDGWDMDFISGTIWATTVGSWFSANGGDTWTQLELAGCGGPMFLEINPQNHQEKYIAPDGEGVCKSEDGGLTFQHTNEGLAAIVPLQMAVSSIDPDTLYVRAGGLDVAKSESGGQAWRVLDIGIGGTPKIGIAVDPFEPERVYVNTRLSDDGGETWRPMTFTLPITYTGWMSEVSSIAPHPREPGHLLAALTIWPDATTVTGLFYTSDDYGEHWNWAEPAVLPTWITQLAYDAFDPDLVYAATQGYADSQGSGVWKSNDGGETWQVTPYPGGRNEIHEVFTHPAIANLVYAYALHPTEPGQLYVSDDAGETWTALPVFSAEPHTFSPIAPHWLFGSCGYNNLSYLCRSLDGGLNWEPVQEVPAGVHLLSGGSDGERLVLYIGSPGGFVSSLPGGQMAGARDVIPGRGNLLGAGIYRLTMVLPGPRLWLPLVFRR